MRTLFEQILRISSSQVQHSSDVIRISQGPAETPVIDDTADWDCIYVDLQ